MTMTTTRTRSKTTTTTDNKNSNDNDNNNNNNNNNKTKQLKQHQQQLWQQQQQSKIAKLHSKTSYAIEAAADGHGVTIESKREQQQTIIETTTKNYTQPFLIVERLC